MRYPVEDDGLSYCFGFARDVDKGKTQEEICQKRCPSCEFWTEPLSYREIWAELFALSHKLLEDSRRNPENKARKKLFELVWEARNLADEAEKTKLYGRSSRKLATAPVSNTDET